MPIIKSAIKRVRLEARRQKRNTVTKNTYKELVKQFISLVDAGNTTEAAKLFPQVQKALDMAAKKNLLHKNNVARKKSNLAKLMAKSPAAKPAAKKAPAKKATAKKDA